MHHRLKQLQKLARLASSATFRRGIRYGVGASIEHTEVLRNLGLSTVLDVGANVGQFSLLAVSLFSDVRIEAFEPLAGPAATFRRLFDGDARVRFHQVAIGSRAQEVSMNVSRRHDSSSILPITHRQTRAFPGTDRVSAELVKVVTLDSVVDHSSIVSPALLKLDVQGFELEALKGALAVLGRCDYVYAEISFVELYEGQALAPEVTSFLAARRFSLAGVYNVEYGEDGRTIQCDALFKSG